MWCLKTALNFGRIHMEISVWTWVFVSEAVVDVNKNESVSRVFVFNTEVRVLNSKTVKQILSWYKLQSTDLNRAENRSSPPFPWGRQSCRDESSLKNTLHVACHQQGTHLVRAALRRGSMWHPWAPDKGWILQSLCSCLDDKLLH